MRQTLAVLSLACAWAANGQQVEIREAMRLTMPSDTDSNSPAFWLNGEFHVINSTGEGPVLSRGPSQTQLTDKRAITIVGRRSVLIWIEAVWVDPDGDLYAWYHEEHEYICGGQRPAQAQIGALVSYDAGLTFFDLGPVLTSGDPPDCSSQNGYTSGGPGDFTVVPDRASGMLYFLFSNYGGAEAGQGVAVARMAIEDRYNPAGRVWKYFEGEWSQPGIGGGVSPIFPAVKSWQVEDTDSFWGPSVHYNTFLEKYVMLLNRSCCSTGYPQEGIYVSFNSDIANPSGWSAPAKILENVWWYPQVIGLGAGETDSLAGETARLWVYGASEWEVSFRKESTGEQVTAAARMLYGRRRMEVPPRRSAITAVPAAR